VNDQTSMNEKEPLYRT